MNSETSSALSSTSRESASDALNDTYNRVNDYVAVSIKLASPDDIRSWSYGEVKKPETINYRTYRSEKDGLFCERIFGPERDWECFCGKYKGIKHKGMVCDRCGVKITHSRVRRKRMGHIELVAPVTHIWFFKAMPSRIGILLGMKTTHLERVIYFQDYVVVDPGDTSLKRHQLLTEEEYRQCRAKFGDAFESGMGSEAIEKCLLNLDLERTKEELRKELKESNSKQKTKDIIKRLKTVEMILSSKNDPTWMVLKVIPVIPPDLRPLVLLESGNFATSDLNDLYRRLINRNNRLRKLLELNAPEVIIRNEKRMLQQSVDALFDNSRCRRAVLGSSNRPLKSLTDMIKGKQGRFRENLLGKRVDYSARSVIVVGPDLFLHQCGLPKKIALELYQPFIIHRLKEMGYADTIKSAKKMLERKDEEVWDILEDVIKNHPVLLNRAPTLHRMGIQAFLPVLVEGNAIKLHPLVCTGFNADFDGDQMAVHLPLSIEAQAEATTLMLSTNNIFSPANGNPIIAPSQDIVLGCYYLTVHREGERGEGKIFSCEEEVFLAYSLGKVTLHAKIFMRIKQSTTIITKPKGEKILRESVENERLETTPGRVIFNDILEKGMPYYNFELNKKALNEVISDCYKILGRRPTLRLLDRVKSVGFQFSTKAGLSFSKSDLTIPKGKQKILEETQKEADKTLNHYRNGIITDDERYNKIIDAWTHAREQIGKEMMETLKSDTRDGKPYLNPIYLMAVSGARGSVEQIRQLAGMRGLMAKPSGKIIETPIKANFREGLTVLEYFSSTHGARKGLADTALKTADSGYLTRKLTDVAQNVVVNESDCGTLNGITKEAIHKDSETIEVSLADRITGRTSRQTIVDVVTDQVIVRENELITEEIAKKIEKLDFKKVRVRSPLTCETPIGICSKCYGMDRSRSALVELGLAVGIIGAQSIGEPGTQLTMRTFHIGGTVSWKQEEPKVSAKRGGKINFANMQSVKNADGKIVVLNRSSEIVVLDDKKRELERYAVPLGAILEVDENEEVKARQVLAKWEQHFIPILAEKSGRVKFDDLVEGKTIKREKDRAGIERMVVIEHKGDLHPQIGITDTSNDYLVFYGLPDRAHVVVKDGSHIKAGDLLAKTPREVGKTQDITGGLPRVTEIFEARRPKNPAIMSEIDGIIEFGDKRRGKRSIVVNSEGGMEKEHLVPHGKETKVQRGDRIKAGDALVNGPLVPQDILRICGEEPLQQYLLQEVQNVYRAQNVTIDDKHIEIIIAQMLKKVKIDSSGNTNFLPGSVVDKFKVKKENDRVIKEGGTPAVYKPLLLGITKASLQSDSFISAASFQETTKVLTEAALAGKMDPLVGLKENVILGHLVPAGTGFPTYLKTRVKIKVDSDSAEDSEMDLEDIDEEE